MKTNFKCEAAAPTNKPANVQKDLSRGMPSQKGKFTCELHRGYIMQKIALERLDISWMKTMVSECDVMRLEPKCKRDEDLKKKAEEALEMAKSKIQEAKSAILFLTGETCADLINELGGYMTLDEHIKRWEKR